MTSAAFLSWIVLGGIAFFSLLAVAVWMYRAGDILRSLIIRLVAGAVLEALFSTVGLIFVNPRSPFVSWMNAAGRLLEVICVVWFAVGAFRFKEKVEVVE